MSDELDPDVLALLRRAMPLEEAPDDARARMRSALEARISTLAPGAPDAPRTSPGSAGTDAAGRALRGAWVGAHPWLALSGAFVLGGALGALVHGAVSAPRVVYVDRPVPVAVPPAAVPPAALEPPAPPASSVATPAASAAPVVKAAPAPADTGQQLKAESALLDLARTALARGEGAPALAAVERHAAQFPRGLLREEREALAVKALVLAGRGAEAKDRSERFRERYPESLFRPAVDASVRSIP